MATCSFFQTLFKFTLRLKITRNYRFFFIFQSYGCRFEKHTLSCSATFFFDLFRHKLTSLRSKMRANYHYDRINIPLEHLTLIHLTLSFSIRIKFSYLAKLSIQALKVFCLVSNICLNLKVK